MKQTWLAEKLGKSFNMVNAYVCNRKQPSLEILNQIAEILQVGVKDLIIENKFNQKMLFSENLSIFAVEFIV
ncbi:MAG: helix-turn-helix transcriptional regulator [Massilibacteroides sp.]|nr:helix-turn-helix transcriptional regulator [Massilibacteroides sp.]MDD3062431.1 helix-turn-helix transcriptional regulator [Massilibacteroides sp.]MDD4115741.1 helix-turn-helix transcriptional regulator [Massilibacteroides sp.]MDD4661027.1 helix-turn-helix transcriptional regulator [Massilibacteroides sp.]